MKELKVNDGINIIKKAAANKSIKTFFKNKGFSFIFPDDDIFISCNKNKVNVITSTNMFEMEVDSIEKCNIVTNTYFTRLEFVIDGEFKVCFEY